MMDGRPAVASSRLARLAFAIYDIGVRLVALVALIPYELVMMMRRRDAGERLRQRLGRIEAMPEATGPRIIVHAVSLGELAAAGAYIREVVRQMPAASFVVTTGNDAARAASEALRREMPNIERCLLLPWDRAASIRRWLEALDPRAVVIIETEIWPNLFRACAERQLPLFIANGRIYPADVARYRWARFFFRWVLAAPEWIGVQSSADRDAFIHIGAPPDRVEVVGNLKFDLDRSPAAVSPAWTRALGAGRPVLVAGSTHAPEERILLDVLTTLTRDAPLRVRLVMAPRRPARAHALSILVQRRGYRWAILSNDAAASDDWDVLIVDRVGPLREIYRHGAAAFIGGTVARHGGHNPLEAAVHGVPVLVGPHVEHIRTLLDPLLDAGGALAIDGSRDAAAQLADMCARLLADDDRRIEIGERARRACEALRGGAVASVRALARGLARDPSAYNTARAGPHHVLAVS